MGWTTCYNASHWKMVGGRNVVDRRAECDKMLTWSETGCVSKVLKSAMVGSTYYGAVEQYRTNASGEQVRSVIAVVILTCGQSRDGTIWGYKDMCETSGPNEDKCPPTILALLTPTESKYANDWRARCRENIAKASAKRKNKNIPLYTPKGVSVKEERGSWIITSDEYKAKSYYSGVQYTKKRWGDYEHALRTFLYNHGTNAQRREFADSGRECPKEWKCVAA